MVIVVVVHKERSFRLKGTIKDSFIVLSWFECDLQIRIIRLVLFHYSSKYAKATVNRLLSFSSQQGRLLYGRFRNTLPEVIQISWQVIDFMMQEQSNNVLNIFTKLSIQQT